MVLLATYVLAARGAGNLYPFSTFDMCGGTALDSGSRIVARDGDELALVTAWDVVGLAVDLLANADEPAHPGAPRWLLAFADAPVLVCVVAMLVGIASARRRRHRARTRRASRAVGIAARSSARAEPVRR